MSQPRTFDQLRGRNGRRVPMGSKVGVTNPDKWHMYPAGAHHLLTECSPTLHALIEEHLPHLNNSSDVGWRGQQFDPHTLSDHAKRFALYLEAVGIPVATLPAAETVSWADIMQAFSDVVDDTRIQDAIHRKENEAGKIDPGTYGARLVSFNSEFADWDVKGEKVREFFPPSPLTQGMAPMTNDASPTLPSSSIDAQEPHRCARFMIIGLHDGSDMRMDFQNPRFSGGWKFRNINGVPMLIIGHGVPRRHIPLTNVSFMDLMPEDEL